MTPETEEDTICPVCGGWGETEHFSEQSWDWEMRPCYLCRGKGEARKPEPPSTGRGRAHRASA